jgi:hypothetical protein
LFVTRPTLADYIVGPAKCNGEQMKSLLNISLEN